MQKTALGRSAVAVKYSKNMLRETRAEGTCSVCKTKLELTLHCSLTVEATQSDTGTGSRVTCIQCRHVVHFLLSERLEPKVDWCVFSLVSDC
jgi:hypothetical protein